jgi:membrane protease YdiL (CAAX protease family)
MNDGTMMPIPFNDDPAQPGTTEPVDGAPAGAAAARFCGSCGAAAPADGSLCPCADRARRPDSEILAESRRERRSVWSAVALYSVLLVAMIAGTLFMKEEDTAGAIKVENLIMLVHAGIVVLWCLLDRAHTFAGLAKAPAAKWVALALTLPIATFAIASFAVRGLESTFGSPHISYSAEYLENGYSWAFVVLVVCVEPAIVEELAFRGVILGALRRAFGVKEAVVTTAFLFMMLHLMPLSFPHLLLIGLVLGYLRVASGSLYPCMIAHFVHNGLVILAEYLGY